jgi:hypothetical protein
MDDEQPRGRWRVVASDVGHADEARGKHGPCAADMAVTDIRAEGHEILLTVVVVAGSSEKAGNWVPSALCDLHPSQGAGRRHRSWSKMTVGVESPGRARMNGNRVTINDAQIVPE